MASSGAVEIRYAGVVIGRTARVRETATGVFIGTPEPMPVGSVVEIRAGDRTTAARVERVQESADPEASGIYIVSLAVAQGKDRTLDRDLGSLVAEVLAPRAPVTAPLHADKEASPLEAALAAAAGGGMTDRTYVSESAAPSPVEARASVRAPEPVEAPAAPETRAAPEAPQAPAARAEGPEAAPERAAPAALDAGESGRYRARRGKKRRR